MAKAAEKEYKVVISNVSEGSVAEQAGVKANWELLTVNGQRIPDILAYRRELEKGIVEIVVKDPKSDHETAFICEWEDPGLEFDDVIFDGIRLCANKCDFCYIHQMPKGMRKSLYIMDDDYRTSFLYGSFVTLTNLDESEVQRILDENLSPLYVSVHTMDQVLRQDMMKWWKHKVKDEKVTDIAHMLHRLEPIQLYTQMVVLPNRNDGEHLSESLKALSEYPNIEAVAVVPVGLTNHRKHLAELKPFTKEQARDLLKRVEDFQKEMLEKRGTRFVFASDEFYITAGYDIPPEEYYEDFSMIENGVGMVRDFLLEELPEIPKALEKPKKIILATGLLFYEELKKAVSVLDNVHGLELIVRPVTNITFGKVTTVAGLLAGQDLIAAIEANEADLVLVSPNILKYGTETFLDNLTLDDLRRELNMDVRVGGTNLKELVETIIYDNENRFLPRFGFSTHAIKESAKQH